MLDHNEAVTAAPTPLARRPSLVLAVLLFAGGSFALSQTLVVTALPNLAEHFDAPQSTTAWVLTAYLLSGAVATPIVGKLGDVHGKRRTLTAVMLVFTIGAAINTVAHSLELLIAGRVLQGTAAGLFPLAFGVIRDAFPTPRIAASLGMMSAVFGIGAGIGLPLSGLIVDHLSIAWLFGIGLLALPAALATHLLIPDSPPGPRTPIDWPGAALLAGAIGGVLLGISQGNHWGWTSAATVGSIAGGLLLAAAFVRRETRVEHPLLDLAILRYRPVAVANLAVFLVGASMFIAFVLNPQLAQTDPSEGFGFGTTPTVAGLLLLSTALSQLVVGPVAGQLGARTGFRPLLTGGLALMTVAGLWMVVLHDHEWDLVVSGVILGTGIACASAAVANQVVAAVPRTQVGVATGMNTVMRTAGGAFGSAVATACLAGNTMPGTHVPAEQAFTLGFGISAAIGAAGFVAAWYMPRRIEPVEPAEALTPAPASPHRGSSPGA